MTYRHPLKEDRASDGLITREDAGGLFPQRREVDARGAGRACTAHHRGGPGVPQEHNLPGGFCGPSHLDGAGEDDVAVSVDVAQDVDVVPLDQQLPRSGNGVLLGPHPRRHRVGGEHDEADT